MNSSLDSIAAVLARFPNCRVTINRSPAKPRPREGDCKFFKAKGGWHVRRHRVARDHNRCVIGQEYRNGRPVWEWVKIVDLDQSEKASFYWRLTVRGETKNAELFQPVLS